MSVSSGQRIHRYTGTPAHHCRIAKEPPSHTGLMDRLRPFRARRAVGNPGHRRLTPGATDPRPFGGAGMPACATANTGIPAHRPSDREAVQVCSHGCEPVGSGTPPHLRPKAGAGDVRRVSRCRKHGRFFVRPRTFIHFRPFGAPRSSRMRYPLSTERSKGAAEASFVSLPCIYNLKVKWGI